LSIENAKYKENMCPPLFHPNLVPRCGRFGAGKPSAWTSCPCKLARPFILKGYLAKMGGANEDFDVKLLSEEFCVNPARVQHERERADHRTGR
jgi:hypothetical protein